MSAATVLWSGPWASVFQVEMALLRALRKVMMQLKCMGIGLNGGMMRNKYRTRRSSLHYRFRNARTPL